MQADSLLSEPPRDILHKEANPYVCVCVLSRFSCVRFFATLWTAAHQTLSMGFARQIYWSGLPFPTPGDLPYLEIEPESLMPLAVTSRQILYY